MEGALSCWDLSSCLLRVSLSGKGREQSEDTFLHSSQYFPTRILPFPYLRSTKQKKAFVCSPWAARWSSDTHHLPSALVYLTRTPCHLCCEMSLKDSATPSCASYLCYHSKLSKVCTVTFSLAHCPNWPLQYLAAQEIFLPPNPHLHILLNTPPSQIIIIYI